MRCYDRILGIEINVSVDHYALFGRYTYIGNNQEYLIPKEHNDIDQAHPVVEKKQLADEYIQKIFSLINEDINEAKSISPLIRNYQSLKELTEAEKTVIENYYHIENVLDRPETDIQKHEERIHVSRVKRINYKTISFLSTHSEDWEVRCLSKVVPKKLYAEDLTVDYNIYENIVTKGLIHKLSIHFNKRAEETKSFEDFNKKIEAYQQYNDFDNNSMSYRIYSLWDEEQFLGLSDENRMLNDTQKIISDISKRLTRSFHTPLVKNVFKRINLSSQLSDTNKFKYHSDYRYVKMIWENINEKARTFYEIEESYKRYVNNFNRYVHLCVLRSLEQLGCLDVSVISQLLRSSDTKVDLSNSRTLQPISITKNDDGSIILELYDNRVRIIPLPCDLLKIGKSELENVLNEIKEYYHSKKNSREHVVIVYHRNPNDEIQYQDRPYKYKGYESSLLSEINQYYYHAGSQKHGCSIIPVSPMDIFSIERISKILFQWVVSKLFELYPPRIEMPNDYKTEIINLSKTLKLINHGNKQISILDSDLDFLKNLRNISTRNTSAKNKKNDPQKTINEFINNVEMANDLLQAIKKCPCCGKENKNKLELRDHECFEHKCLECSTIYGLIHCAQCNKNLPYIKFGKFNITIEKLILEDGTIEYRKIEELFGKDLMIGFEIVNKERKEIKWICPNCSKTIK